ncbi:MAG: aspartate kinase [Candidatus Tectomicrobia bacterium]|nr:aspartate kinase [Candidatus Tectomicrobia bacterium]
MGGTGRFFFRVEKFALIVQKYGGTSVGDLDRIRNVARRVARALEEGNRVVVVVSAMAGETDKLLGMARALAEFPNQREVDYLLSSGERVTSSLLTIALNAAGYPAVSFTGLRAGIRTTGDHTHARIRTIVADEIIQALEEGRVPVVAGFQGVDEKRDVTTLGRGGSDLTAVALAAALHAERCQIYTDVPGVFTADPRIVPEARKLDRITYDEMLEMAGLGAKVLQARSVEFAKKYSVAVEVRSSFTDEEGTLVTREDEGMERVVVSAVNCDRKQAQVTLERIHDRPGIAGRLFGDLADAGVVVDMIVQNVGSRGTADISFTVPLDSLSLTRKIMETTSRDLGAKAVRTNEQIAKVSVVGIGMKSHSGVAARMFQALADHGINILMISTSEILVSCVVDAKYAELAVRTLHEEFGLAQRSDVPA